MDFLLKKLKNKQTWFSIAIALILFYIILSRLDAGNFFSIIQKANIGLFIFSLALYFILFPILASRWQIFLSNIGVKIPFRDLNAFIFLQWFVNSIIPAKLGDLYKAYLVKKHYNLPMSKIVGTVFMERLLDIIFATSLLILSSWIVFEGILPDFMYFPIRILLVLIVVLIVCVILIKNFKKRIVKILPVKIKEIFINFESGTTSCLRNKDLLPVSIYTILLFLVQVIVVYLLAISINLNISFIQAVFITMVAGFITIIPLTPAGVGVGELAVAGILLLLGVEKNLAISGAILMRAHYWSLLLVGGIFYLSTPKK